LLIGPYWATAAEEVTGITENALPDKSLIFRDFYLYREPEWAPLRSRELASLLKAPGP
jgi:hypothetical protein